MTIHSQITPGEIEKGMIIVPYQAQQLYQAPHPLTGTIMEDRFLNENPNFKGIPFEVLCVVGHLVYCRCVVSIPAYPVEPPIVVHFDLRWVRFLEMSKEDYQIFLEASRVKPESIPGLPPRRRSNSMVTEISPNQSGLP